MLTQLNEEIFIDIKEHNYAFKVLVLNVTESYAKDGFPFLLHISGILIIKKTTTLKKCFRLFQENNEVGAELFIKAIDKKDLKNKDLEEFLKKQT